MDRLEALKTKIEEAKDIEEDYPGQINEYRRQLIVEAAMEAADEMIMECSDGSVEETDYLTSVVAVKWAEKVRCAVTSKLLRSQLMKEIKKPINIAERCEELISYYEANYCECSPINRLLEPDSNRCDTCGKPVRE